MFLQEPGASPYDLNFRLAGIPVRVHPWFWLVSVVLGWGAIGAGGPEGFLYLLVWVACVFVSILVHEMGHVLMGQVFGSDSYIVLYSFGGLAVGSSNVSGRWQRIAVLFAGPGAGFILLAVVGAVGVLYDPDGTINLLKAALSLDHDRVRWPRWAIEVVYSMIWINLMWGLVNLLPVFPLDGGQISRELCVGYIRDNGLRISLIISLVTAAAFAVNSLYGMAAKESLIPFLPQGGIFSALFFGLLAFGSWQLWQQTPSSGRGGRYRGEEESYERAPWERDADWWKRG